MEFTQHIKNVFMVKQMDSCDEIGLSAQEFFSLHSVALHCKWFVHINKLDLYNFDCLIRDRKWNVSFFWTRFIKPAMV